MCAHVTECCSLEQGASCCTSDEEQRLETFLETCLLIDTDCFRELCKFKRYMYMHVYNMSHVYVCLIKEGSNSQGWYYFF